MRRDLEVFARYALDAPPGDFFSFVTKFPFVLSARSLAENHANVVIIAADIVVDELAWTHE